MSNLLTARKPLIWQPQQPAYPSKGGGLAVGLSEVIVPHTRLSAVRRLPNVSRGTGIKPIQTPGGIALGVTTFTNNGTVAPLDWPHHGFRLTPPFTIGAVVYLNSSSTVNFPSMFSSNNSGWRLRASGGQFIADVTRAGATVTVTDATVQTVGTVHVLMFVVTASTIELFVDGVSVATGSHSSYSAGNSATVAVSSLSSGGVQNAGGTLQLASWTRACTLADAVAYARNPWAVLEDDELVYFSAGTHTTSGAVSGAGATVAGTATHKTLHTTTGATTGGGATVAGAATHKIPHTTSGDVAGGGATVAGTAAHKTLHTTSGTVAGAGATVAGAATHPHTTTGAVTGGGATVAGASDHITPGGIHATIGDVAGGGATVAGAATHLTLHATSGAVQGGGATVTGDSAHLTLHTTTGDASGGGATVAGAASRSGINEARSGVVREWLIQFYEQEWAKPVQVAKAPEPPKKVGALKPAVRAVRNALDPVAEAEKVQKAAPRVAAPRKSAARAAQPAVTTIVQTVLLQAQKAALQDREFVNALNTRQQQQRAAEAEEAEDEELLLLAVL